VSAVELVTNGDQLSALEFVYEPTREAVIAASAKRGKGNKEPPGGVAGGASFAGREPRPESDLKEARSRLLP
jgi:hypothetical protein